MPLLSRDRIVAQAQETIERRGYEALSLRGLASSLDVTAPALYDHVQSKDDVLRAVAARGYEALAAASAVEGGRAIERVRERSLAYVRFARDRSELFRLMFRYRPAAVLIEADNELAAATHLFDTNTADLARAIADGDLAPGDPIQIGLTLWAAMHGVATVATLAPPVADSVAESVVDAMLTGLSSPTPELVRTIPPAGNNRTQNG